jgi:hypothetical protein
MANSTRSIGEQDRVQAQLASWALWFAAAFMMSVLVLHGIEPEFEPRWRTVSEYSLGAYGWVMKLAFIEMGAATLLLSISLWRFLDSRSARAGAALVGIFGVCSVLSAFYSTDSSPDIAQRTTTAEGEIHSLIGQVGLLSVALAVVLMVRSLGRQKVWTPMRTTISLATAAVWICLVVAFFSAAQMGMSGGPSPNSWFGIGERLLLFAIWAWTVLVALAVRRAR